MGAEAARPHGYRTVGVARDVVMLMRGKHYKVANKSHSNEPVVHVHVEDYGTAWPGVLQERAHLLLIPVMHQVAIVSIWLIMGVRWRVGAHPMSAHTPGSRAPNDTTTLRGQIPTTGRKHATAHLLFTPETCK